MFSVSKTKAQVNLCVDLQSLCCELFQSFESMVKNCFDNYPLTFPSIGFSEHSMEVKLCEKLIW